MGEISITKLLVVAALVVLLFGTKKLRTLGGDLGTAIKGFKKAMNDDNADAMMLILQTLNEKKPAICRFFYC